MRLVVIGCEYAGKTTLIDGLMAWGDRVGVYFHRPPSSRGVSSWSTGSA